MTKQFVTKWIELIRPIFPSGAIIGADENNAVILRIDWFLGNDQKRQNRRSRLIIIVVSREAIEDCQDFDKAGLKFQKIIEKKFSTFNPDHNHSILVRPPAEKWVISTLDLN
jgi:hypothetical protein